ncbi:MAG: crossover junction endodeoxyribonuclease RuvC [Anaerolineales bacterium]|nr:crossover junction endodeoxyribonuclease RuvC [Anaerolineales bacterium]
MLALGIDPGTAITGYGLVRSSQAGELSLIEYGTINTPANTPMPQRLEQLYQELSSLLQRVQPDIAAVEKIFFSKNVRTAMSVGQARGVALLALSQASVLIGEYTPNEIKQAIAGYGSADKQQVQQMVKIILNMDDIPRPDDAADGLAVAICHLHNTLSKIRYEE